MLTDLQVSKLDRRFELLDVDGDGVINAADYDLAAAGVCAAFGHRPGSRAYDRVHMAYLTLWTRISREMDRQGAGRITRRQFIDSCADAVVERDGGYEQTIAPVADAVMDVIDANGDGLLSLDELTRWFNAYGVCADDAERIFRQLDLDGDGVLDRQEIQHAIADFYRGDDPDSAANLLFGPISVPVADVRRRDG
jgi:Ca2+-binding EF-hand superfamily protein